MPYKWLNVELLNITDSYLKIFDAMKKLIQFLAYPIDLNVQAQIHKLMILNENQSSELFFSMVPFSSLWKVL